MEQGVLDTGLCAFKASSVSSRSLSSIAVKVGSVIQGGISLSSRLFLLRHRGRPVSLSNSTTLNQRRFLDPCLFCFRGIFVFKLLKGNEEELIGACFLCVYVHHTAIKLDLKVFSLITLLKFKVFQFLSIVLERIHLSLSLTSLWIHLHLWIVLISDILTIPM